LKGLGVINASMSSLLHLVEQNNIHSQTLQVTIKIKMTNAMRYDALRVTIQQQAKQKVMKHGDKQVQVSDLQREQPRKCLQVTTHNRTLQMSPLTFLCYHNSHLHSGLLRWNRRTVFRTHK
jgi:hypothetical protein